MIIWKVRFSEATVSTQLSNNPMGRGAVQKQGPSIYTVLLFLSMLFMLIAVIAMWMEMRRYQPDYWKVNSASPGMSMTIQADSQHFA